MLVLSDIVRKALGWSSDFSAWTALKASTVHPIDVKKGCINYLMQTCELSRQPTISPSVFSCLTRNYRPSCVRLLLTIPIMEWNRPAAHRRHDISDMLWELFKPDLPWREGTTGFTAHDNRNLLNAFFDPAHMCTVVRFASWLWILEKYLSPFLSVDGYESIGKIA